jgi:hypothetical protein
MPQLSAVFGDNISEAKAGIQGLSDQIGNQVLEASKTLQEIDYVLDRAEKMMSQFDERLDIAKSHGIKPVVQQVQQPVQRMVPPVSKKQAILPQNVVPKVVKQQPVVHKTMPRKSAIEESLESRSLGGVSKKVQKFRPRTVSKGSGIIFKNTSPVSGAGAYGAAAAVQKSGGGKDLATEQEEGLIRALQERL